MGLILPQEVEIKLTSNNVKYWESKGYDIPKRKATVEYMNKTNRDWCYNIGSYISVNVIDLKKESHAKVNCKCDYCGDVINIQYRDYNKSIS